VVIAIIALLIGILLPALGRARNAGRLAVSMNNLRQILIAQATYRFDKKDSVPMQGYGYNAVGDITGGWDTWHYGGKNCADASVASGPSGGYFNAVFDDPAYCRPLNNYLYSELAIDATPTHVGTHTGRGVHTPGYPTAGDRKALQMPVFKSPGDRATAQGSTWPNLDATVTSYDQVGTSYHLNMKWWDQPGLPGNPGAPGQPPVPGTFTQHYNEGVRRIKLASEFDPTNKFVWIHDQTTDQVANVAPSHIGFMGEFGEKNKSVHAYLDGRVNYNLVRCGYLYDGTQVGGQWTVTGKYTYIFVLPGGAMPPPNAAP
jgi:type II secretory pathway pseudopilin PulG